MVINMNISSDGVREDIIRFMNDLAEADGIMTEEEEINLNYYSIRIRHGKDFFENPEKY
jgi:hypothetical protein